jgi:hypothetical protein
MKRFAGRLFALAAHPGARFWNAIERRSQGIVDAY